MSSTELAKSLALSALVDSISEIKALNLEEITRGKQLGEEFGFGDILPDIQTVRDRAVHLSTLPLLELPVTKLQALNNEIRRFFSEMTSQLRDFDPTRGRDQRDAIAAQVKLQAQQSEALLSDLSIGAELQQLRDSYSESIEIGAINAAKDEADKILKLINKDRSDGEAAVLAIQKAAPASGIPVHAREFTALAVRHERISWISLGVAGGLSGLFLSLTSSKGIPLPDDKTNPWLYLISNLHTFSVPVLILSGIIVMLKVFTAERHNALVNRHRATALKTFEAFANGSSSEMVRDAVLLQTTNAIFAHQATGYLKGPIEIQNMPVGFPGANAKTE